MDAISSIAYGFSLALIPVNLLYCFAGVFIGTLIGVLPGIGPVGAISILLPITFYTPPVSALIFLAGIFYGAQYGGSTTSILVNIPGEATTVVTCLDGHQMARQGRAGPALGIAAFGSFIAGTLSTVVLMLVAPPLAEVALKFGPPEYCTIMLLGMTFLIYLSSKSIVKAMTMALVGFILAGVGTDVTSGTLRFTFGIIELNDGIGVVPLVMGLFGISEVLINVEQIFKKEIYKARIKGLLPDLQDWKASTGPIARGSLLGFVFGILPGAGSIVSTFISYAIEKKISKNPEKFGKGAIEGVAGPESANNAGVAGAFIPLLTLGLPSNAVMAVFLGALMIHGVQTGPLLMASHPDIFWGFVASMYVGNCMLLVLNLPLIGIWVKVLKVPYRILFPLILFFCVIGSYSINYNVTDVLVMFSFGVAGYLMKRFEYDLAPLVLAYVLGPLFEDALQQTMNLSNGSFAIFLTRPIAAAGTIIAFLLVISSIVPWVTKKKSKMKIKEEIE
jgi:putative tricarboxylic transport membrane protein